jgi:hypothetical protein
MMILILIMMSNLPFLFRGDKRRSIEMMRINIRLTKFSISGLTESR